ncbi:MAG: HAD-IB family hydrolase [Patescibacteria group bacterium]|nr:HAD-IB family hydrolase [Patescibacteria group bacterium]MDD4611221.1 HAD-IB family hydrolase [Patescibacteria group bacterium]
MALAIFDLDGTLIRGQSQMYLIFYLRKKGLINFFDFVYILFWFAGYKLGIFKNPRSILEYAFKIIKGRNVKDVENLMEDFYKNSLKLKLNNKIVEILKNHQKNQDQIVLVTSAIKPVANIAARELGINHVIATNLEMEDGRYMGCIEGKIVYGTEKVKLLTQLFNYKDLNNSYIYTDHKSDTPLLKITKHPILIK